MKKLMCLLTALLLVFGATACRNERGEAVNGGSIQYVEEEIEENSGLIMPGAMQLNSENQLVVYNFGAQKPEYVVLGPDGSLIRRITCDFDGDGSIFTLDTEDNLYIVASVPAETALEQRIHVTDSHGKVIRTIELESISFTQEEFDKMVTGIALDSNGNILLSRSRENILVLDKNGNELKTIGETLYAGTSRIDRDDCLITYGNRMTDYKNVLQKYDISTGKSLWTTIVEPEPSEGIFFGTTPVICCDPQDNSIYLLESGGIQKLDAEGKYIGEVLSFKDHTILASGLVPKTMCVDSEKTFYIAAAISEIDTASGKETSSAPAYKLYKYSLQEVQDDDKKNITLSVPKGSRLIDVAAGKFNKSNPDYRIDVKEFGGSSGTSYAEQYINTLNTELMSGLGPDIISVSLLPFEKYISKGFLADLTQMMEADAGFRPDEFYTNIFDAMKVDGKLYAMPASIKINALAVNKKAISDRGIIFDDKIWTWDDFGAIRKNMLLQGDDGYIIPPVSGSVLLTGSYYRFVRTAQKEASFSSGEFAKMLELARELGMDGERYSNDGVDGLFETAPRGTVLFSPQVISDVMMLSTTKTLFGSEIELCNLPRYESETYGGSFTSDIIFAINNNSGNREKAWEFIKILLSEEIQSMDELKGFPVRKQALTEVIDRNNALLRNQEMVFSVSAGNGEPVTPEALVDEEVQQLLEYVEGLAEYSHIDSKALEIIQKEAKSFFAGKKTAAEAADSIEQKMNLYLNE